MNKHTWLILVGISALTSMGANASIVIDVGDNGSDLTVYSAGGTIDLSAATQVGTGSGSGIYFGGSGGNLYGMDYGSNIKYKDSGGSNVTLEFSENWSNAGGPYSFTEASAPSWMIGYYAGMLLVPTASSGVLNYDSFTGKVAGQTISSTGLTENSWVKVSWNTNTGTDSWQMNVIPEPATLGLAGLVAGSMVFIRRTFMI